MLMNGGGGGAMGMNLSGGCNGNGSRAVSFGHPSRSLSVPEGLSVVTSSKCAACDCRWLQQKEQQQQQHHQQHPRCRSITDIMGNPNANFNPHVQVVEQMTTSV